MMELLILIGGVIQFIALIRFFGMASDIAGINRKMQHFTKYYYDLQEFKNARPAEQIDMTIINKPIGVQLSMYELEYIYKHNNDKFMEIANHFYKTDKTYYTESILPLFEKN